ncbi:WecB/TagA/CpsF family glycosyltransferase, partial [bacterium]|nr:WecB/TagA/CpsF family glycosyltransferase [bacterium]
MATPPWAIVFTLGLIIVSALILIPVLFGRYVMIGDSGLFSLGYLLAGVSMLGFSKSLLMFGLLIPSMVTVYPFFMICLLIVTSYLGNELYQMNLKDRRSSYAWTLSRERLIVFSGLLFIVLNFAGLLVSIQASWEAYLALLLLFLASGASFARAFAKKKIANPSNCENKFRVLGQWIDIISPEETIERVSKFLEKPTGVFHIVTADSLALLRAYRNPEFSGIMSRAGLIVPDGAGLSWAIDFLGSPITSRVPGVALVSQLCERASRNNWPVYFLGGNNGIAAKSAKILSDRFPGLKVLGTQCGFFLEGSEEEHAIIQEIRDTAPKILFVAMGVPKQEYFINRMRLLFPPLVAIGVGGSFDVISGVLPRAPVLMQRFALEWLFRLWKEPRRFQRILSIPRFVIAILRTKWNENIKSPKFS